MTSGYSKENSIIKLHSSQKIRKRKIMEALRDNKGIVSYAADDLGVSRTYVTQMVQKDPQMKAELIEIRESLIDMVEKKAIEKIEEGDKDFIKFFLRTLGKHRGYQENQSIDVTTKNLNFTFNSMDEAKETFNTDYVDITDEQENNDDDE